jgi:isocitrate dehydrogenase
MAQIMAPAMVYITGEEMTRVFMEDAINTWVKPYLDISQWEFYDLSCKSREGAKGCNCSGRQDWLDL